MSLSNCCESFIDFGKRLNLYTGATGWTGATGSTGAIGPTGPTGLPGDRYNTNTVSITSIVLEPPVVLYVAPMLSFIQGNSVIVIGQSDNTKSFEGSVDTYNRTTGRLTIVNIQNVKPDGTSSLPAQIYNVNLDGIDGPTGPIGPTGPKSSVTGATGPQGANGSGGTQGPQGPQGANGTNGTGGTQGPQGSTGFQGVQGPQGSTGIQGVQGPQGSTGFQGVQGPQGSTGIQGPQGSSGGGLPAGDSGVAGYGEYLYWNGSTYAVNTGISASLGRWAGQNNQALACVAIGYQAGRDNQNFYAVGVGNLAGASNQGTAAIAIGYQAGRDNQHANSIILNATGSLFNSQATNGFYATPIRDSNGNVATTNGLLLYNGGTKEITATTKSFVIHHPNDKDKYLVHACLEGPEAGVYYRGKGEIQSGSKKVVIFLPEYVKDLATDLTVHVTPIVDDVDENDVFNYIRSSCVRDNTFTVYSNLPCKFHWVVYGKRADVKAEVNKSDVILHGDGPYKWLEEKSI